MRNCNSLRLKGEAFRKCQRVAGCGSADESDHAGVRCFTRFCYNVYIYIYILDLPLHEMQRLRPAAILCRRSIMSPPHPFSFARNTVFSRCFHNHIPHPVTSERLERVTVITLDRSQARNAGNSPPPPPTYHLPQEHRSQQHAIPRPVSPPNVSPSPASSRCRHCSTALRCNRMRQLQHNQTSLRINPTPPAEYCYNLF